MNLKGKKIACFVALPHHTRFLLPITEYAEKNGAKIIYFTTMADFPYERDLIKKGRECKILQDYINGDIREKISDATGSFFDLWKQRYFEWDDMKHWALVMHAIYIVNGFEEYFCLESFIKTEKPDMFLALHERNRWGKLIGHLSTKYCIPYVTLQEGDYYEDRLSFSGHTEFSTALLTWGRGIEDCLSRMKATPEKFVPIGNTHLATVKNRYFKADMMAKTRKDLGIPDNKKVVLFLVGIQWGVIKELSFWEQLLGGLGEDGNIVKIFKWHPKVSFQDYKKNAEEALMNRFPSCIAVQNYDPYSLLPVADYCIALGKTTLAVEALFFGKPLFSLPGTDGIQDHYSKWGISQLLFPPGNYGPLYKTIRDGVPEEINNNVKEFLSNYFYKNNNVAVERSFEVICHIFESRNKTSNPPQIPPLRKGEFEGAGSKGYVAGRASFIIPSGDDPEALASTLTSLSRNVKLDDREVVIAVNSNEVKGMLSGLYGDVKSIEVDTNNLPMLYNKGVEISSGEYLIFIKPGIVYSKDEGLLDAAKNGIAGVALKNTDMTPYCLGIGFDFNHVPYMIKEEAGSQQSEGTVPVEAILSKDSHRDLRKQPPVSPRNRVVPTFVKGELELGLSPAQTGPPAVGGGLLGMHRDVFDAVGGFDGGIANHLIDADICLSVKEKGYTITYLPECLGIVYKETFIQPPVSPFVKGELELGLSPANPESDNEWKGRIKFFAKWCGKLPKDDDYIKFAGDLLKE